MQHIFVNNVFTWKRTWSVPRPRLCPRPFSRPWTQRLRSRLQLRLESPLRTCPLRLSPALHHGDADPPHGYPGPLRSHWLPSDVNASLRYAVDSTAAPGSAPWSSYPHSVDQPGRHPRPAFVRTARQHSRPTFRVGYLDVRSARVPAGPTAPKFCCFRCPQRLWRQRISRFWTPTCSTSIDGPTRSSCWLGKPQFVLLGNFK